MQKIIIFSWNCQSCIKLFFLYEQQKYNQRKQACQVGKTYNMTSPQLKQYLAKQASNKISYEKLLTEEIPSLKYSLKNSFEDLTNIYHDSAQNKEQQLFRNFLTVLDKISDDVVRQQQRYRLINKEKMLDEKSEKLNEKISQYREECYEIKDGLNKIRDQLKKQRKKKSDLQLEIEQLRALNNKKNQEVEMKKTYYFGLLKHGNFTSAMLQPKTIDMKITTKYQYQSSTLVPSKKLDTKFTMRSHSTVDRQRQPLYMYKLAAKTDRRSNSLLRNNYTLEIMEKKNWV